MRFKELGVEDTFKDKIYLAAFLSCWLCLFVFPQKGAFLRPGVFKVASTMADGKSYSLGIPVLANIYHGLGLITKATNWTYGLSLPYALCPRLAGPLL